MAEELRGIYPRSFIPEPMPPFEIVWVYVNWLNQEINSMAEEKWPMLKFIKGHRRREVIEYLSQMPDWTIGVLDG